MTTLDPGGLSGIPAQASDAAAALASLKAPADQAAQAIDDAFTKAGVSLTKSLARAASDGKITLQDLARAALAAFNALMGGGGGSSGGSSLSGVIATALSAAFSGARADGGPVTPGGAFLVGERGPEVFRPATAGTVEPAGGGGVTINLNLAGADAPSLIRSDAQIAQALARAVSLGARGL
jgi:hypothetical protein